MGTIKKSILDKVLKDLNLTPEQVVEEGLMDKVRSFVNRPSATTRAANNLNASMPPNPNSNLKEPVLNTMTTLKQTAKKLEQQASSKPFITGQEAGGMFKQFNDQLLAGGRAVQAAAGGRQPVPPKPAAPAQPNVQTAGFTPSQTPAGLGVQPEGQPTTVSQDYSQRPPLLNPWTNPQGQLVRLTPEQEASLNPAQKAQYAAAVQLQFAANTGPKPLPPSPPQANVGYGPNSWTIQ